MMFPNYAGVENIDNDLSAELSLAGIKWHVMPLESEGEVKTHILGSLHRWTFKRAWYYWIAEGPGIPCDVATDLWNRDKTVRVAGHCASPSPLEWWHGFGVGLYHVDTPEGLSALAETIKSVYRGG